jgi:hypothetical protein
MRGTLWVPIIHPSRSGGMPVLMEDAAEPVASADIEVHDLPGIGDWFGQGAQGRGGLEGPVGRCSL